MIIINVTASVSFELLIEDKIKLQTAKKEENDDKKEIAF